MHSSSALILPPRTNTAEFTVPRASSHSAASAAAIFSIYVSASQPCQTSETRGSDSIVLGACCCCGCSLAHGSIPHAGAAMDLTSSSASSASTSLGGQRRVLRSHWRSLYLASSTRSLRKGRGRKRGVEGRESERQRGECCTAAAGLCT